MAKDPKFDQLGDKDKERAAASKPVESVGATPEPTQEEKERIARGASKLTRNLGNEPSGPVGAQSPQLTPQEAAASPLLRAPQAAQATVGNPLVKCHEPDGKFGRHPTIPCKHCGKRIYAHQASYACPARN